MHTRRALLYVPGDDRHKTEKATGLNADCICLDLEDGVAVNRKAAARNQVADSLATFDFHGSERLVRLNSLSSGLCSQDLDVILPSRPDGVYLPKVNSPGEIQWINEQILAFEQSEKEDSGRITLVIGIESALGILNLTDICRVSDRLTGLVFGAEDYVADIGGVRTTAGDAIFYARSVVVTCATAFNLQAIDMVCTDYKDEARLLEECRSGVTLGFSGKQVIHPGQVEPVQMAFTPDPDALDQATRIVHAYQENLANGKGAFVLDGKMVDLPVVKAAERLLARASVLTRGE
jgi:citrate lyase subunit beta-like protein